MKPTFIILRTECCNLYRNTPVRILLQEVVEGEIQQQKNFYINPGEAEFDFTITGIQLDFLRDYPLFPEVWKEVDKVIRQYPFVIAPSDGYSMHVLYNAFQLWNMSVEPIYYITAKNICRKGIDTFMYSTQWLAYLIFDETINESDLSAVDNLWARLILKAVTITTASDLDEYCKENDIIIGHFNHDDFKKCGIKKKYRYRPSSPDIQDVDVHPNTNNPFCGAAVVFTGKLEAFTRMDAQRMVLEVGGSCPSGVSSKVNYLVVGTQDIRVVGKDGLSGKMKKAAELHDKGADIEIISETEFLSMINIE